MHWQNRNNEFMSLLFFSSCPTNFQRLRRTIDYTMVNTRRKKQSRVFRRRHQSRLNDKVRQKAEHEK